MKKLSLPLLARLVTSHRKALKLSQEALSARTGINRSLLSRLERGRYQPNVDQLLALSEVLGFSIGDVLAEDAPESDTDLAAPEGAASVNAHESGTFPSGCPASAAAFSFAFRRIARR